MEPNDLLNVLVEPHAALDRELTFTVAKAARQVVLQISRGGEKAAVPIDTSARVAPPVTTESAVLPRQTKLPLQLAAGTTVRMGDIEYEVLSAEINRHNFENDRIEVRIGLRATNKGRYDSVFSYGALRLLVDGVLRAPDRSISRFHERLPSGAEMDREITFVEARPTQTLALGFLDRSAGRYTKIVPLLPKPGA